MGVRWRPGGDGRLRVFVVEWWLSLPDVILEYALVTAAGLGLAVIAWAMCGPGAAVAGYLEGYVWDG